MENNTFHFILISSFLLLFSGCGSNSPDKSIEKYPPPIPLKAPLVAESWISKPKNEWPQIVLTNSAEFNGHTPLHGASSFLIQSGTGRIFAATAAHLIGDAGGVEPRISIDHLTPVIRSWKMFPRTLPDNFVEITSLGIEGIKDGELDWLILSIKEADKLPASPLKLRKDPVKIGESVYLIGCPYVEKDCNQNVYVGKVTARTRSLFRYDIEPAVDIRGFSGAPIIDQKGYVVGVMTVWFKPKMSEEKYLEAGGEDVAPIVHLINAQR